MEVTANRFRGDRWCGERENDRASCGVAVSPLDAPLSTLRQSNVSAFLYVIGNRLLLLCRLLYKMMTAANDRKRARSSAHSSG